MTVPMSMSHHETAASVVAAVRAGASLPQLVDRVVRRIRAEIPCYAAAGVVQPEDLRVSVRANVEYILDSLAGTARANLTAPDATGRTRAAQGVPLAEMLTAYRVEAREILRTRERERAAMVEVILTGVQAKGTLWEVANALRLPLDGAFLVVAAETELGHDPMPGAESALAAAEVRSVWRLD